jgi:hypothetical protein
MADLIDVGNAIRDTIAAALYPNGTGQPSVLAFPIQVYGGWPQPEELDADLKAGSAHVSIWPTPNERPAVDHFPDWQVMSVVAATLTATVATNTVTIGGTVSTPQSLAVIADNKAFSYAVQGGDTLAGIAAAVAAGLTAAGIAASAVGAVITLASAKHITARVGGSGTSFRELRRQERVFQVSCWAWAPDKRDALAAAVDVALGANWRILLADSTYGNMLYRGSSQHDESQKQLVYRRDVLYSVEFATIQTRVDTQVLVDNMNLQGASVIATTVPVLTTNF